MILNVLQVKNRKQLMLKMVFVFKIFILYLFIFSNVHAKNSNFFNEGKELFEKKVLEIFLM